MPSPQDDPTLIPDDARREPRPVPAHGPEALPPSGANDATFVEGADDATLSVEPLDPAQPTEFTPPAVPSNDATLLGEPDLTQGLDASQARTLQDPGRVRGAAETRAGASGTSTAGVTGAGRTARATRAGETTGGGRSSGADLRKGDRIGNYELIEQVGEGGQGVVWRAFSRPLEKEVALKFLLTRMVRDPQALGRMKDEAKVLLDLTHERIVRLYNLETDADAAYLVMEWLGGPTLSQVMQERKRGAQGKGLTVEETLWLLEELAPALDYANSKGVTHRDIKPANIMLSAKAGASLGALGEQAKLTDFGIAVMTSPTVVEEKKHAVTGTLPYMAPEVLEGSAPTPAADMYSLGVTLYYLVSGKLPASSDVRNPAVRRATKNEPPASGDEHLDAAILAALAPEPTARPASADDLLFLASHETRGRRASLAARLSPAKKAGLAIAALAVLGSGLWVWWPVLFGAKVELTEPEPNLATGEPTVRVRGQVDARTLDSVRVDFAELSGSVQVVAVQSDGSFEIDLPTPTTDGPFNLRVLDGERVVASANIVVDRTAPVAKLALADPARTTFAAREPLTLVFECNEAGRLMIEGRAEPIAVEAGSRTVQATAVESDSADPEQQSVDWHVVDACGNRSLTASISYDVFSRAARKQALVRERPAVEEAPSSVNISRLVEAAEDWQRAVNGDRWLPIVDKDEMLGGPWAERLDELRNYQSTLEHPVVRAFEPKQGISGLVREDGRWYTSSPTLVVAGTIDNARAPSVTLQIGAASSPLPLSPGGAFEGSIGLAANAQNLVRLTSLDMPVDGEITIVHDARAPALAIERTLAPSSDSVVRSPASVLGVLVAPSALESGERASRVALRKQAPDWIATIDEPNLASLWVHAACDGEKQASKELSRGQDGLWSAEIELARDGQWTFELVALDVVGLGDQRVLGLVRDATPPELELVAPGAQAELTGSAQVTLVATADEDVRWGEPELVFVSESGSRLTPQAQGPTPGAREARWSFTLLDRIGRLELRLEARDLTGNPSARLERSWKVQATAWGGFPPAMQSLAELVPPAAGEQAWIEEADGRRLPARVRHKSSGLVFVYVPSGTFEFGSPKEESGRLANEGPARSVDMSGFYISRTEVAQREWDGKADERPCHVSWADASDWCKAQGFVLPTEAQWEYAASGPAGHAWPGSHVFVGAQVNSRGDRSFTDAPQNELPVDSLPEGRSWCGAVHMAGNAWEWCRDDWGENLGSVAGRDPRGPIDVSSSVRVARGGALKQDRNQVRCAYRRHVDLNQQTFAKEGFRPVWEHSPGD